MDPVSLGIGALGMGASMLMDYTRKRKAERALARMGKRPQLSVPKEVMASYQNRLNRSKLYQGFSQAEIAQNQKRIASSNAGLASRMQNMGGSAQAIQTGLGNQNANANTAMAAQSAQMNRAGQANDLAAADRLGGQIGGVQTANEQQAGAGWDQQMFANATAIQNSNQAQSNLLNTVAGLGFQGAIAGIGSGTTYDPSKYTLTPINGYKGSNSPSSNRGGR